MGRPFWIERRALVSKQLWNVNAISQCENIVDEAAFSGKVGCNSCLLLRDIDDFEYWNAQTRAPAMRVFNHAGMDAFRIGVPLVSLNEAGGVASNAPIASTYTKGSFWQVFCFSDRRVCVDWCSTTPSIYQSEYFRSDWICKMRYSMRGLTAKMQSLARFRISKR
ncbi:MAG: hypothetical protein COB08_013535 [Rhodobacteraceae bacterium]|nr:hypothetical protein [Paracoccaceae bacterium]